MTSVTQASRPQINTTDLLDMQMLVYGHDQWRLNNESTFFPDQAFSRPDAPLPKEPFTATRMADLVSNAADPDHIVDLETMDAERLQSVRERLQSMGLERFMDDGALSMEEILYCASETGKAKMDRDPDYRPSEDALNAASLLLDRYGIEDIDGTMAQGLATNLENYVGRVNEGLGFAPSAPTPDRAPTVSDPGMFPTLQM